MKTKIIGILLLSMSTLMIQSCGGGAEKKEEIAQDKVALRPLVNIQPVENKSFHHEIRVQGNVETDQDITLTAEMGGLITSVNIKEGQTVRKGQVIAQVDASVLSSNYQELETQLKYAEYMLSKQEELQKRGVGSEFDLETAKNQVNSLKANMNSLNTQRGKAIIRAPFTGVIDEVFAKNGQMAGPAMPIVRLVNNSTIDVVSTVSEKHFSKIKVGTPIRVSFPNYSDTTIDLHVTNVGNYIEPTNRTFRIMSTIKNNKYFLPNMLAEVNVTDMAVENGLVIPSVSILKDQKSNDFVFIAKPYTGEDGVKNLYLVTKKIIEVIEKYEGAALIDPVSGLKKGEFVVVGGAKGISDGNIVRIK